MAKMIDRRNWTLLTEKSEVQGRKKTMEKEIMVNSALKMMVPKK